LVIPENAQHLSGTFLRIERSRIAFGVRDDSVCSDIQTAVRIPAPRMAGFWKVSHQTEKLFDFSDKFDAQKCKGPERWATTHNRIERGRPTSHIPEKLQTFRIGYAHKLVRMLVARVSLVLHARSRHFSVPNFRASTGCFSSKPLRHPIPSLRWQTGRNAGRADSPYPHINPKS